ncbi:MAG: FG-GAP-like repeat-containing protein [Kiritimatiellia bacterium]|jgi:fibronectin type 3 domain-containing protein
MPKPSITLAIAALAAVTVLTGDAFAAATVEPARLTNAVMQGAAAPTQVFTIGNTGGTDFDYAVTVISGTNWMSAQPLSGICSSAASVYITNTYTTTGLTHGVYSGIVQVVAQDGLGFGQTNLVDVTMRIVAPPVIAFSPSIVTQTVSRGVNLVNQEFSIWNGSMTPRVPMAYTFEILNGSPELIRSLDHSGGVSSGETNRVSIAYVDGISASTGVYNASVRITAWDPGDGTYAPTGTIHLSATLNVQVTVTALPAPTEVTASDGTYTNKVAVSWSPVTGAASYVVYSAETFDPDLAAPIGQALGTNFDDLTAQAGVLYYYWVSSMNSARGEGPKSTNLETGYRSLAAPGGIFATDGAYIDKVRVTWPNVDGATGYQLYRRKANTGDALEQIFFTAGGTYGGVYDDVSIESGMHYEYKVGATNGLFGSALSVGDTGYSFGVPGKLTASKGAYVGQVRVTWETVESASEYEVWRSIRAVLPPGGGAVKVATVTTPVFDDGSVLPGTMYYYWARAYSLEAGIGGWSALDRGYGASAGVDLWVRDLVVLPLQMGVGGSPAVVSFRMGNGGGANMADANGTVGMEFFASTNQALGAGNEYLIGKVVDKVTLAPGDDMVMKVAGSQLAMPSTEGDYNIFVRVLPEFPSLLADTIPDNNVTKRSGSMRIRSSGGLNYHAFDDYDGDGISDLGVYRGTEWSVRSVDERVLAAGARVFGGAGRPVLGDLDGDRRSDPMAHDGASGIWQILYSGSGYRLARGEFGASGYLGLVADYEGVGHGDMSVFHEGNGRWYVLKSDGGLMVWNWGSSGYEPVIGDYNGDGRWDMAVYQESSGLWYIRTLDGQLLASGAIWGGPGFSPVPGDYDGDGLWDAAVYQETTGRWYIGALDGRILALGIEWGGLGLEPVMGDYNGDGKWDLGLYQEATGLWYIASLDGEIIAWASHWGGRGYRPIGK